MKTITMYELLGMVKDGKAPKKILFLNHYYIWKENNEDYQKEDGLMLFGNIKINYILNSEVEIIEEKKIPEKWDDLSFSTMREKEDSIDDDIHKLKFYIETIMRTQNEVIDYLKSKGDE